jgi:hypothetical protein
VLASGNNWQISLIIFFRKTSKSNLSGECRELGKKTMSGKNHVFRLTKKCAGNKNRLFYEFQKPGKKGSFLPEFQENRVKKARFFRAPRKSSKKAGFFPTIFFSLNGKTRFFPLIVFLPGFFLKNTHI